MKKKHYMCDDCGYECDLTDDEYDGVCPNCHEHHGFYEVDESLTEAEVGTKYSNGTATLRVEEPDKSGKIQFSFLDKNGRPTEIRSSNNDEAFNRMLKDNGYKKVSNESLTEDVINEKWDYPTDYSRYYYDHPTTYDSIERQLIKDGHVDENGKVDEKFFRDVLDGIDELYDMYDEFDESLTEDARIIEPKAGDSISWDERAIYGRILNNPKMSLDAGETIAIQEYNTNRQINIPAKRFFSALSKGKIKIDRNESLTEAKNDNNKLVIYKSFDKFRVTPKSNYDARIQNERQIQKLDDFSSADQIIDYYIKYGLAKDKNDFIIIDESLTKKPKLSHIKKRIDETLNAIDDDPHTNLLEKFGKKEED